MGLSAENLPGDMESAFWILNGFYLARNVHESCLVRDLIREKYIISSEGAYLMRDLPGNEGSCW